MRRKWRSRRWSNGGGPGKRSVRRRGDGRRGSSWQENRALHRFGERLLAIRAVHRLEGVIGRVEVTISRPEGTICRLEVTIGRLEGAYIHRVADLKRGTHLIGRVTKKEPRTCEALGTSSDSRPSGARS